VGRQERFWELVRQKRLALQSIGHDGNAVALDLD
jgi:hypothetical protein